MVINTIEATIASSKQAIKQHGEDIANAVIGGNAPSFYIQHDSIFLDYANIEVYGLAFMAIRNGAEMDDMIMDTQRQINNRARCPESSTSTNSNMIDRYKLASLANLLQVLTKSIF